MLRRHLKSGGAPVTACAGFDFDAANAYLEDALGRSQRAGFESHLAGCASCRRHLIELSRLAKTVPHVGAPPSPVADQTPAWVRWREVIVGWSDLSSWNLKWQMVGAAGAMFTILIAALSVQSWRQAAKQADSFALANTTPATQVELKVQPPSPEPTPQGAPSIVAGDSVMDRLTTSRATVPAPKVELKEDEPNLAVAPS